MEDVRSEISYKAKELFLKNGIRSVSIDDICTEIRMSKKTFYLHFSDKAELVREVVTLLQDDKKRTLTKMMKPLDDLNAIDFIFSFTASYWKMKEKFSEAFFYDVKKYYPEVLSMYTKDDAAIFYSNFERMIKKGISEGMFREDMDIHNTINVIRYSFASLNEVKEESNLKAHEFTAFLIDLLICVLVNERGRQYYDNKRKTV